MTRTKTIIISLLAAFLSPMAANADLIDFEEYDLNEVIAAGTDLGGVAIDQEIKIFSIEDWFPPFSTGKTATTAGSLNGTEGFFSGVFTQLVSNFSIAVGDACCDPDTVVLSVFDAGGNLLGTDSFSATSGQLLSVNVSGIKSFRVAQTGGVTFDNLMFDVTPVPEPGTLALLGLGLIGMAARRRKKV